MCLQWHAGIATRQCFAISFNNADHNEIGFGFRSSGASGALPKRVEPSKGLVQSAAR